MDIMEGGRDKLRCFWHFKGHQRNNRGTAVLWKLCMCQEITILQNVTKQTKPLEADKYI